MAGRVGFGRYVPLRTGASLPSRFVAPRSLHKGALWLAAAAPLTATAMLLAIRFGV